MRLDVGARQGNSRMTDRPIASAATLLLLATITATSPAAADDPALADAVPLVTDLRAPPPSPPPDWVKRVQVKSSTDAAGEAKTSLLSVQPLYQLPDQSDTLFTQLHFDRDDQAANASRVSNLGLGYRKLLETDFLVGIDGFYDRDWSTLNQRAGADAELRWKTVDLTVNYYRGLASEGLGTATGVRPPDGYELGIATQLPYLPWARARVGSSESDRQLSYTTGMQLGLLHNIGLDVGLRDEVATNAESRFVRLNVRFDGTSGSGRYLFQDPVAGTPFEERDLSGKTLDRVRRTSAIPQGG